MQATGYEIPATSHRLEIVLHAKLHDARVPRLARDTTEGPRVEVRRWIAPVEMVQQVECFDAQLEPLRSHRNELRYPQVQVPEVRPKSGVPRQIAEGSRRRLRERVTVE